jgi:hypothetical protein
MEVTSMKAVKRNPEDVARDFGIEAVRAAKAGLSVRAAEMAKTAWRFGQIAVLKRAFAKALDAAEKGK